MRTALGLSLIALVVLATPRAGRATVLGFDDVPTSVGLTPMPTKTPIGAAQSAPVRLEEHAELLPHIVAHVR